MGDDLLSLVKFFCGFCKQNWPLQSPLGDDDDDEIEQKIPFHLLPHHCTA